MPRRHHQYYDPLGLPPNSARLHHRLIRSASPRRRPLRRASRVQCPSLNACCAPYPGETRRAIRYQPDGHGLRRDMSGSALPLFMFRGCRLHFMLRPAFLLPPKRLSTPRSGHQGLPQRLGPATGLTGDYPGWTHTSRRNTARRHDPNPNGKQPRFFTTHHGFTLPVTPAAMLRRATRCCPVATGLPRGHGVAPWPRGCPAPAGLPRGYRVAPRPRPRALTRCVARSGRR
jgi:hypothetical protein